MSSQLAPVEVMGAFSTMVQMRISGLLLQMAHQTHGAGILLIRQMELEDSTITSVMDFLSAAYGISRCL